MLTRHIISLAAVGAIAAVGAPRAVFAGANGACCLPNATCDDALDQAGCEAVFGLFQGDGTSCDNTVCANVPFNFNLSPGSTTAELPQFDSQGGTLNLLKATLAIDAQINAEVTLLNISMGQFIFDTTVTYDGQLTATLAPLPDIAIQIDPPPFDCGADVILAPQESCDFGGPLTFPASPEMSMANDPPTDLSSLVGNGTIGAFIEAEGTFAFQGGVPFTLAVPLHNVTGTARVAYLFQAKVGACCLPDGTCQDLTSAECDAASGTLWTINTPCSQASCGGACCLQNGTCTDGTTQDDCVTGMGGEWQGQFSECGPESCPGACCLDNGDCLDDQTLAQCDAAGGEYQGLNSTCAVVGDSCCVGTLGDFIWNDLNGDGIQDPGEPGIDGIRVILSLKLPGGGTQFLAEATTSGGGLYEFTGLCAGDYLLEIDPNTVPPGLEETPPNVGGDPTKDSDCDGGMVMLTLPTNGSNDDTVDCGFREPAGVIGDFIWQDTNGNGIQDPGEPGIPNVTVCLYGLPADDLIVCTTTDAAGEYFFTGLDAGDYRVEVDATTLPPNFTPSPANVGDDEFDSDCVDGSATATLATSQDSDLTIDCGFVPPSGVIGDFIWEDTNGDGIQDPGEPGLPGVTVCLCLLGETGETELTCTTTNAAGIYEFTGLAAGDYLVKVDATTLPPGLSPSPPNEGGNDDLDSDCVDGAAPVTLPTNDTVDDSVDCGFRQVDCDLTCNIRFSEIPLPDDDDDLGAFECDQKIVGFTMVWDGDGAVRVRAYDGDIDDELLFDIDDVQIGDAVSVEGLEGPNNVIWEIFRAGGDHFMGESEFHRSCSDDDMDGPEDCGTRQGNGKDDDPDLINDWILVGLVDGAGSILDCTMPSDGSGLEAFSDDDDDDQRPQSETLIRVGWEAGANCFDVTGVIDTECAQIVVPNGQRVRLTCISPPPPTPDFDCEGKIISLTMIWDGDQPVRIKAYDGDTNDDLLADIDDIQVGDEVTVGGLSGPNDVIWEIFEDGTDVKIGESKFHRSCSDDEMDGPEDCGTRQGNGKSNDEDFINDWILEGLADDKGNVLDCSMPAGRLAFNRSLDDDDDIGEPVDCAWFFNGDILVIQAQSAVFRVTATNAAGEIQTCEIDLCEELDNVIGDAFELASFDAGPDPEAVTGGLASMSFTNELHLTRDGQVMTLVDEFDDDGLGQTWCETVYVIDLYVAPGATLLTNGCPLYYVNAVIEGDVDFPENLIQVDLSPPCPADTNGSGAVDFADLNALMTAWGTCPPSVPCVHDLDGNGEVGFADLTIALATWGSCPE